MILIQKDLIVIIILLLVATCFNQVIAQETEKPFLLSRGNWLYVGGSGSGNYTRIQDAVDNASDYDTIFVYQGKYYENVEIDTIINLIGQDKNTTIIDGGSKHDVICIHNNNNGVTVSGFTIQNSGNYSDGYTHDCGIDILSNNNTIENNIIIDNVLDGIRIGLANDNFITKNTIKNNTHNGIWVESSHNNTINQNMIINNMFSGIEINFGKKNIISENIVADNNLGIYCFTLGSNDLNNILLSNNITNNRIGVSIENSKTFVYRNNFINNSKNAQVLLSRCKWNENYWDDWNGVGPKWISGIILFNFDWHPAHQPYYINCTYLQFSKINRKHGFKEESEENSVVFKKSTFSFLSDLIYKETPSSFSWKDYNGEDYTTPAKDQGPIGACWAFAALGALESVIKIREKNSSLNPDLSEQYLISCLPKIRKEHNIRPFFWIMNTSGDGNYCNGVPIESCFPYEEHYEVPPSHIQPDWKDNLVPILDFGYWIPNGTHRENRQVIKSLIIEKGPVTALVEAQLLFKKWGYSHHSPDDYYPKIPSIWRLMGKWGGLHLIVIVGWKDIPLSPSGGYWICKNSWGTDFGYDGFFNLAYGALGVGEVIYPIDSIYVPYIGWVDYNPANYEW